MNKTANKKTFRVILLGKSGSGKTSLINLFMNMSRKEKYEDKHVIAINQIFGQIELECNLDEFMNNQDKPVIGQENSQTQRCNFYPINNDELNIIFIDTPGFLDTEGLGKDEMNLNEFVYGIQNFSDYDAILFVHMAEDSKIHPTLKYAVHELLNRLPKECKKNLITCFTNKICGDNNIPAKDLMKKLNIESKSFNFQNDCLTPKDLKNKNQIEIDKLSWKANEQSYKELIEYIGTLDPQPCHQIKSLHHYKSYLSILIEEEKLTQALLKTDKSRRKDIKDNILDVLQKTLEKWENLSNSINYPEVQSTQESISIYTHIEYIKIAPEKITQCVSCLKLCHNPFV